MGKMWISNFSDSIPNQQAIMSNKLTFAALAISRLAAPRKPDQQTLRRFLNFDRINFGRAILVAAMMLLVSPMAIGQQSKLQLPVDPGMWLNSPPISSDMLAGKGAVIYFYEEGCPSCRARWPGLLETAKKFQGKPIVFIAVNSGNSVSDVSKYLQQNNINWPTIVDSNRTFERAAGINEISLQNIYASGILDADGNFHRAGDDLAASAARVLESAKWNIDPEGIPSSLQGVWRNVESGNFAAAGKPIQKAIESSNEGIRSAGEKLNSYVQSHLDEQLKIAADAQAAGDLWLAYKTYYLIGQKFKGYEMEIDVSKTLAELKKEDAVDKELTAANRLTASMKQIAKSGLARSAGRLKKIIEDFPDTEAAASAQRIVRGEGG